MPRGGFRANSGRKGLSFKEKQYAARRLRELIDQHQPIRERRAFARRLRGRVMADDESYYDELMQHYDELAQLGNPPPQERAKMSAAALLSDRAKARAEYMARYRHNPKYSAIHSFFNDLRLRGRVLTVPGPTKPELGAFHQQIADELTEQLRRPVSRLQVADAVHWMTAFDASD